jgi:hypothetical protein
MMEPSVLIRFCGLFENTSKDGSPYFVGVAGGVKVLVLRNKNAAEGEPGWNLCFTARPEKSNASAPARVQLRARTKRPPIVASADPARPRTDPDLNDALPLT